MSQQLHVCSNKIFLHKENPKKRTHVVSNNRDRINESASSLSLESEKNSWRHGSKQLQWGFSSSSVQGNEDTSSHLATTCDAKSTPTTRPAAAERGVAGERTGLAALEERGYWRKAGQSYRNVRSETVKYEERDRKGWMFWEVGHGRIVWILNQRKVFVSGVPFSRLQVYSSCFSSPCPTWLSLHWCKAPSVHFGQCASAHLSTFVCQCFTSPAIG